MNNDMIPKPIVSETAWEKKDLINSKKFLYPLSKTQKSEIDSILLELSAKSVEEMNTLDLRLPTLSNIFAERFLPQLTSGLGALLIRGLSTKTYNLEALSKIHFIMAKQLGTLSLQFGQRLLRVEDQGYDYSHPKARNSNVRCSIPFHNDSCDILALMTVRNAKQGGELSIVSTTAIYNELLKNDPELLNILMQPFNHNVRKVSGQWPHGGYYQRPIFQYKDLRVCSHYSRLAIVGAQKASKQTLSKEQMAALDKLEEIAADPTFCYTFKMKPGDLLYLNNEVTFHARKAFEDYNEPDKKRLLLRLHITAFS